MYTCTCTYNYVYTVLPRCYAPTLFCDLIAGKKRGGGGQINEDLRFRLVVKPPPHTNSHTEIIEKLCCAVENENSFDRHAVVVLKDRSVVGHVHVAIF